jgi:tetratricopeptide (TPR) repeat protein
MRTIARKPLKLTIVLAGACVLLSGLSSAQSATYFDQAKRAHEQKKYDEAIRLYTQAIDRDALDKTALGIVYHNRGIAWAHKGRRDKAIADYSQAIELKPKYANAYYYRGLARHFQGEYDKAIADQTRVIQLQPKNAEAYFRRACVWDLKRNYDKSIADYTRAIELNPKHIEAYCGRGRAWYGPDCRKKAITDFTRAIKSNPNDPAGYEARISVWFYMRQWDKAIADHTRLVELSPKEIRAYWDRAYAFERKGDYKQATADYTRAIKLEPENFYSYFRRARAWDNHGDFDKATADYKLAADQYPGCLSYLKRYGLEYFEEGKFAEAAKAFHRYVVLKPGDASGVLWRYIARRRAGQPAGKDLTDFASKYARDSSVWPGPVLGLFVGRIDAAKCLKAAESKKDFPSETTYEELLRWQLRQAYFYIAQYELIVGRKDRSREFLKKCVAPKDIVYTPEYFAAKAELKRMGPKKK